MSTYTIRVLRNGTPVEGATVWAGSANTVATALTAVTDANGTVSATIPQTGTIAVSIKVPFAFGGGPFFLPPGVVFDVEVG